MSINLVLILLTAIILILLGTILVLTYQLMNQYQKKNPTIQLLLEQNRELLNRIQAPDARTFQALQASNLPIPDEIKYVPKDDESEAAQLRGLAGSGDVLYNEDEEIRGHALETFGASIDWPVHGRQESS